MWASVSLIIFGLVAAHVTVFVISEMLLSSDSWSFGLFSSRFKGKIPHLSYLVLFAASWLLVKGQSSGAVREVPHPKGVLRFDCASAVNYEWNISHSVFYFNSGYVLLDASSSAANRNVFPLFSSQLDHNYLRWDWSIFEHNVHHCCCFQH